MHGFAVGFRSSTLDRCARALVSAHGGGRGNLDSGIGGLDDGANEFVSGFASSSKLFGGVVFEITIGFFSLSFSISLNLIGDGLVLGNSLEKSGARFFRVSSSSADLVDVVFTDAVDHEDRDSDNEHENDNWGEHGTVEEGAAGLLLLSDDKGESSSDEEVDTDDVEEALGSRDKVLNGTIKSIQIEEVVDVLRVGGDHNSHDDHDKAKQGQ